MQQQINGFEVYTIGDDTLRMSFVPEKGGSAYSLQLNDNQQWRELLYIHDNYWDQQYDDLIGGWPYIFPICARLKRDGEAGCYLYRGRRYQLPIHGVAPYVPWQVTAHDDQSLVLQLRYNDQSYQAYPFAFEINLSYSIVDNQLICRQQYCNFDNKPMPYYGGFHPYFHIPVEDKPRTKLFFKPVKRFQYNSDLTDIIGEQALFELPVVLSEPAINENLLLLGDDKTIKLDYADGLSMSLTLSSEDDADMFSYLQLYHMPERDFFCIEPWMSFPNALNSVSGVRWLERDSSESAVLTLQFKR